MILQREIIMKGSVKKFTGGDNVEMTLSNILAYIPNEAVGIVAIFVV